MVGCTLCALARQHREPIVRDLGQILTSFRSRLVCSVRPIAQVNHIAVVGNVGCVQMLQENLERITSNIAVVAICVLRLNGEARHITRDRLAEAISCEVTVI